MAFIMDLEGTPKDIIKQADSAADKYLKDVPDDRESVTAIVNNVKKLIGSISPNKIISIKTNGRAILVHG